MTDERDLFDVLRDSNPADPRLIDAYSDTANGILATVTATPTRRGASRRGLVLAAALLALLTAVAAAAILLTRDITNLSVTCYQAADMGSDRVGLGLDAVPAASACEGAWRDGVLTIEGQVPGTVPLLTACVTETGGLAVFPTGDAQTCEQLGLSSPTPDQPTDELAAFAAAKADIFNYLEAASCQPIDEAEHVIRAILDDHGLTTWTINQQPDHSNRPCATVAYHPEDKTIVIVPDTGT